VGVGVADADGALLAVWLPLFDVVQPAIDKDATIISTEIASNFFVMYITQKREVTT